MVNTNKMKMKRKWKNSQRIILRKLTEWTKCLNNLMIAMTQNRKTFPYKLKKVKLLKKSRKLKLKKFPKKKRRRKMMLPKVSYD